MAKSALLPNNGGQSQIVRLLLDAYRKNPEAIRAASAELAEQLAHALKVANREAGQSRARLTERERSQRLSELSKAKSLKSVMRQEAVTALENAAALLEDGVASAELDRSWLTKLVKQVTGLSLGLKGRPSVKILQPGEPARSVPLIRGLVLNLTWDWKLLSVSVDAKELRRRREALKFVGAASDIRKDVSEKHDDYLTDTIDGDR